MVNYVNTVLVSNLASGAVLSAAPAAAASLNTASDDAGKFIIMNCDPNVASNKLYEVTAANAIRPLYQLMAMAQLRPDGVWDGD